jgi:CBS domain-containing protein/nucleotide-binding universal stress UspA family protein
MKLVKDLMSRDVHTIDPEAPLAEAAASLRGSGIRTLPVLDGDRLVGIITDRDITIRATARGLDPGGAKVRDAMTEGVIRCFQDQPVNDATALMARHRIHRVVVLSRANELVGIISLEDVAADPENAELVREVLERIEQRPHLESPPFAHILVALDGSELAEQVLPYVGALAERFGSKVTLLRAVGDSLLLSESAEPSGLSSARPEAPISDRTRVFPADYLNAIKGRLESVDIDVELEYPEVRASDAIVQRATDLGVALIAMTTHGRGGLGRVVHGSVASDVLRRAPCPVLLVRATET